MGISDWLAANWGSSASVIGVVIVVLLFFWLRQYRRPKEIDPTPALTAINETQRQQAQTLADLARGQTQMMEYLDGLPFTPDLVKQQRFETGRKAQAEHRWADAIKTYRGLLASATEPSEKAALLNLIASCFWAQSELEEAEGHLKEMRDAAGQIEKEEERKEASAMALGNLGLIYRIRGDLDKAEEYLKRSLKLDEEIGNKEGMANQLGNLGIIYGMRGDLEVAEEHLERALKLDEEMGNKEGMAIQLVNLGIIYGMRGDLDRAEEYLERALKLHEEIGNKEGMATALGNLGTVYREKGQLKKAREHYQRALALFEQVGAQPQIEQARRNLEDLGKQAVEGQK